MNALASRTMLGNARVQRAALHHHIATAIEQNVNGGANGFVHYVAHITRVAARRLLPFVSSECA